MKDRVPATLRADVDGQGAGVGLLWILITLVMVALVFLPVLLV